jgi:uncharacterized protein YkwD
METWSVITVLACAHLAIASSTGKLPDFKRPLHEHPTLVKMADKNNDLRRRYGLAEQQVSPELTRLAQRHAEWMAQTGNFVHNYNHGYPEIIYWNARSIDDAFSGWMNSGPHRGIIMSGNAKVGYGFAISSSGQTYWCGVFGNVADKPTQLADGS